MKQWINHPISAQGAGDFPQFLINQACGLVQRAWGSEYQVAPLSSNAEWGFGGWLGVPCWTIYLLVLHSVVFISKQNSLGLALKTPNHSRLHVASTTKDPWPVCMTASPVSRHAKQRSCQGKNLLHIFRGTISHSQMEDVAIPRVRYQLKKLTTRNAALIPNSGA